MNSAIFLLFIAYGFNIGVESTLAGKCADRNDYGFGGGICKNPSVSGPDWVCLSTEKNIYFNDKDGLFFTDCKGLYCCVPFKTSTTLTQTGGKYAGESCSSDADCNAGLGLECTGWFSFKTCESKNDTGVTYGNPSSPCKGTCASDCAYNDGYKHDMDGTCSDSSKICCVSESGVSTSDCSSRGGQCSTNGCNASQTAEESMECEGKDLSSICCLTDASVSGKTSSPEQTGKTSKGIDPVKTPAAAGLQQKQITGNQGGAGAIAPLTIPNVGLPDPQGGIKQVLENLLRWGLGIIGVLALIGFVVSGIQYIVSTGSEDMIESAKRNMLFSTIGIVVVLASFVIIQAINYALEAKSLF